MTALAVPGFAFRLSTMRGWRQTPGLACRKPARVLIHENGSTRHGLAHEHWTVKI